MTTMQKHGSRRLTALIAAGALVLVAIAGSTFAVASRGDDEARIAHMRGAVASVDDRLSEAFSIFRSDRLQVADGGRANDQDPFGQNTAFSRAVAVPRGTIYVIPGDDAVCLGDGINWGHTCVDVPTAIAGDLYLVTLGDPKTPSTTVSGLVPDGVSEVSISLADGTAIAVPVRDNVYDLSLPGDTPPVTGISWSDDADRRHVVELPDGGVKRPSIAATPAD